MNMVLCLVCFKQQNKQGALLNTTEPLAKKKEEHSARESSSNTPAHQPATATRTPKWTTKRTGGGGAFAETSPYSHPPTHFHKRITWVCLGCLGYTQEKHRTVGPLRTIHPTQVNTHPRLRVLGELVSYITSA